MTKQSVCLRKSAVMIFSEMSSDNSMGGGRSQLCAENTADRTGMADEHPVLIGNKKIYFVITGAVEVQEIRENI